VEDLLSGISQPVNESIKFRFYNVPLNIVDTKGLRLSLKPFLLDNSLMLILLTLISSV
jgi:hypothetical protein